MDKVELQKYLYKSAKDLSETIGFDLETFTVIENVVDISWQGQDKDGFGLRLDRKVDLSLIENMIYPRFGIDEEIFICREIINRALNNNFDRIELHSSEE